MPDLNELSEREREILHLVARGASNKEIAQALYISTNTVKVHLRNIFTKIEVTSRTEAAMFAVSAGLVEPAGGLPREVPPDGIPDAATGADEHVPRYPARWYLLVGVFLLLSLGVYGLFALRGQGSIIPAAASQAAPTQPPRWLARAALPTARQGLAATAFENSIYAIGGETAEGVTGILERYDPDTDSWTALASKPVPVTEISAAVIGGRVYVPGGRAAGGSPTDVMEIYDPRQDRWEAGPRVPQPVSGYALVTFEGKLFLFGGWDGESAVDTIYEFDPDAMRWTSRARMPTARAFPGAAVSNGKIYVFGGFDGQRALDVNEVYVPDRDDGQETGWETGLPLPEPRYGMAVASVAEIIHVFGGQGAQAETLPSLEFSPTTAKWQAFESPVEEPWSHLGLVPYGTRLFLIGGEVAGIPVDRNLAYQAIYVVSLPVVR